MFDCFVVVRFGVGVDVVCLAVLCFVAALVCLFCCLLLLLLLLFA